MKREERTERTKKKIMEAAIQEFGKYGYQVSVNSMAH